MVNFCFRTFIRNTTALIMNVISHNGSSEDIYFTKKYACNNDIVNLNCKKVANANNGVSPKNPEQALKIIKNSDIVCFDVDSTVIMEEGIDELATYCGKGKEVARVTSEAMGGSMTFQDALRIRLDIIRPSQKDVANFLKQHPSTLTKGVKNFIKHLKNEGKEVYLISGGFDCLIEPVAIELNIPLENVFANKLLFGFNGEYEAFDTTQPTSRTGGKAVAISEVRKIHANIEDAVITMIGDGATDLEAVPPANYFIGFGGNVVRNEVYERAQYYVRDFDQLYHA